MIFLGTTFCSGRYSLLPQPTTLANIIAVRIYDGTYNHLFLSTDSSLTIGEYDWTYDTQFNANFDGSFNASNTEFGADNVDTIAIKRHELGDIEWTTIFTKAITKTEELNISIKDTYARAGVDYEYSLYVYKDGTETGYIINNVYSDFDGYYITDKDCLYGTIYDIDGCDTSRNMTSQTLELLNSKYMSVVSNSSLDCDSGSISGTFIKMDENGEFNRQLSLNFRKTVMNRLSNKKPLILKIYDGRIWMIRVIGNPTDGQNGHYDVRKITFEWVEIGDLNDMKTLYNYGFSDVGSRWW